MNKQQTIKHRIDNSNLWIELPKDLSEKEVVKRISKHVKRLNERPSNSINGINY